MAKWTKWMARLFVVCGLALASCGGRDKAGVADAPGTRSDMADELRGREASSDEVRGPDACVPVCNGMECGGDGCGGSCGDCPAGSSCKAGACAASDPCGDASCDKAAGEDCLACPVDCGGCCDEDGLCEPLAGEGFAWCGDCCDGDGVCSETETCATNPCDCGPCCPNSACETVYGENCSSCPQDCACPAGRVCFQDACCDPACHYEGCGDDGCGGSCGECSDGDVCYWGECQTPCPECDDGNECTLDFCKGCGCAHGGAATPGCCVFGDSCDDGDPCTRDFCLEAKCRHAGFQGDACHGLCDPYAPKPCFSEAVCSNTWCDPVDLTCKVGTPKDLVQQAEEGLECCSSDADCQPGGVWEEDGNDDGLPGPDLAETLDLCVKGLCKRVLFPEDCDCGAGGGECPSGADACAEYVCLADCLCLAVSPLFSSFECCASDLDCIDLNDYTVDKCVDFTCTYKNAWYDCGAYGEDSLVCGGFDYCMDLLCAGGNYCYEVLIVHPDCFGPYLRCLDDADCGDCDDATVDVCIDNYCHYN